VEGITLADVLERYQLPRCDFLKLDCEGAEFDILRSMSPELSRQVNKIILEYHTLPHRDKQEQSRELVERLLQLGYTIDAYTDVLGTYWGTIRARRAG
jgi:hypothetical protein